MKKEKINTIIEAVAKFPSGETFEGIFVTLGGEIPCRTLQRHLAELTKQGILLAEGKTRARKYRIAAGTTFSAEEKTQSKEIILRRGERFRLMFGHQF